jgi:hypothetical protein
MRIDNGFERFEVAVERKADMGHLTARLRT